MEKITVTQKKSTIVLYIICTAFACALMIYTVFDKKFAESGFVTTSAGLAAARVLFAACAAACGYCAVFYIKRLVNPKPLIIVDENGFTDNCNSNSVGFVPWSDVKRIYMVTMRHNKLIQVELAYPEEYLNRMGGLARKSAEMSIKMGYQPISFSLNGTGRNPDKFMAEMISVWERNK